MVSAISRRLIAGLLFITVSSSSAFAELVERVIDGDTLLVFDPIDGRYEKTRLIGVDTDESVYNKKLYKNAKKLGKDPAELLRHGLEAKKFTTEKVEGKEVILEYDRASKDLYGRTLAYVWIDQDSMLNEELLKNCLARPLFYWPNNKYKKRFIDLNKENCL